MTFDLLLAVSVGICLLGLAHKIAAWFWRPIGVALSPVATPQRVGAAVRGILRTVFSRRVFRLAATLVLDIVLQLRTLKEDPLRWLMHILIYWGFMLLLLMHALEAVVSQKLFSNYYSTVMPYWLLRDVFAAMVLAGLLIAVARRFVFRAPRLHSGAMDVYAIAIVGVIMVSGIFLEGLKITSVSEFDAMQFDYADLYDETEIAALESVWVQDFGLVSSRVAIPFDAATLELGRELHAGYCAECHAPAARAFLGYGTAKAIAPVAEPLDRAGGVQTVWWVHILACLIGLAYLPFSKMFHLVATPVSLLVDAGMDPATAERPNVLTRHLIELDACTHCGTCNRYCSAMMAAAARGNPYILPAEKMQALKALVHGRKLDRRRFDALREGVVVCTNCDRCTVVCPSGIDLRRLWLTVREALVQQGAPEPMLLAPFSLVRSLNRALLPPELYARPLEITTQALAEPFTEAQDETPLRLQVQSGGNGLGRAPGALFANCFGCQTCTTVCPVVAAMANPAGEVGLLPHQIMACLSMGLAEKAAGSKMPWYCLTCYQCQEQCPQQVPVTDLLYELKHMAVNRLGAQPAAATALADTPRADYRPPA